LDRGREAVATSVLDAQPDAILKMPPDTLVPMWSAATLTVLFFGLLFHLWWLAGLGALGVVVSTLAWLRPSRPERMGALHG
jgi:cytochrome c oxidase subunit 1/cytochrome c oxidase subunit I+III